MVISKSEFQVKILKLTDKTSHPEFFILAIDIKFRVKKKGYLKKCFKEVF